jgi:hypothetical protein
MDAALAADDREEWAALNRASTSRSASCPASTGEGPHREGRSIAGIGCAASTSRACSANRVEQAQEEHREILEAMRARAT